jgi:hypothetical protein
MIPVCAGIALCLGLEFAFLDLAVLDLAVLDLAVLDFVLGDWSLLAVR